MTYPKPVALTGTEYDRLVFVIILLTVVIYVIPITALKQHQKIAYAKNGRWEHLYLTTFGLSIKYIPLLNALAAIICWIWFNPRKKP